jgi:hypothetical protein
MASAIRADFTGDISEKVDVFSLEELEASWREAQEGGEHRVLLTSSAPPERTEVMEGKEIALPADPHTPREAVALRETVEPPRAGLSGRQLAIGGAVAVLLAGAAAVLTVVLTRSTPQPSEPRYLVVESPENQPKEQAAPANQPAPTPEPEGDETLDAAAVPSADPDPEPAAPTTLPKKSGAAAGDSAAQLTRTFARQQGRIQSCFRSNAEDVSGSPRVAVRISIDAGGNVQSASVQPAALGSTALGQCISSVARSTKFPPQNAPVVFTIPITAHAK